MALLRVDTERRLAEFFSSASKGEQEVEIARIALSENRDFDPYSAFKVLDRFSNGYLNYLDIKAFLENNRIFASSQEIDLLINQYDSDSDGRLILNDFHQLTLPSTNLVLRDIALNRSGILRLSADVEFLLVRLLEKELNLQRRLEAIRKDLEIFPDFSTIKAFDTIDYPSSSIITRDKIADFLRKNLISAFNDDLDAILRRFDVDSDERLSYSEFSDAIKSTTPSSYVKSPIRDSPSRSGRHSSPLRRSPSPTRSPNRSIDASSRFDASITRSPGRSQLLASSSGFDRSSRSPSGQPEESELVSVFRQQIDLDRDLEAARRDLALCPDFTVIDAFNLFDLNNLGYVTQLEFEDTLRSLRVYPIKDEVSLLFKHYSYIERRLTFTDFSKIVTTKDLEYARLINNRVPQNLPRYDRQRTFSLTTENLLSRVMKLHLENESVAESLRQKLERRPYFSKTDAFQCVDRDRNGYLTFNEFENLLQDYGIYASRKDVENLMERYDKDQDGRVSYSEFLNEVTPKSPRKY
ncbi:unnamed protein product [Blepharisma stoltei]|uniref:EF-hand domain-containing protein n=1 Tax=Blepharisma stoltei TaxID=1481888 RepID=A0AAU9J6Y3_9CILI|nr:unnamed protein product [Blepharisma stoltei]